MLPKRLEIEFTNACNSRCGYCPRFYLIGVDAGFLEVSLFRKIVDEAASEPSTVLQLHRRGESLLHPDFDDMLRYLQGKFSGLQLATNGILLDARKAEIIAGTLTFLSFSIDHPALFRKNRGVDCYEEVEKNILHFLDINNDRVMTQVSMVRTDTTGGNHVDEFVEIWKDRVDRVRIYEEHSSDGAFGSLKEKRKNRKPCVKPFTDMVIFYDGSVMRCNHDWNGEPMGNVNDGSIADIYGNDRYRDLRNQQETLCITDEPCKSCDSWYAEEGKQGTGLSYESD